MKYLKELGLKMWYLSVLCLVIFLGIFHQLAPKAKPFFEWFGRITWGAFVVFIILFFSWQLWELDNEKGGK